MGNTFKLPDKKIDILCNAKKGCYLKIIIMFDYEHGYTVTTLFFCNTGNNTQYLYSVFQNTLT